MDDDKLVKAEEQKKPKRSSWKGAMITAADNAKYLTNALTMWDWQKPDMTDPVAVDTRVKEYFQLCISDDIKPSVEGLALAFGVHRKTLWAWVNNVPVDGLKAMPNEARAFLKKAYNVINVQMVDYMQNGKIHPVSGIFLMKNNMDYEDKKEIAVAPTTSFEDVSAEELQKKYIDAVDVIDVDIKEE